ncbi:MAG: hypothetical protein WDN48_06665 [Pseudolabrys sp.]
MVIETANAGEDAAVRAFLLGTGFAMLCLQRGLFPLHASSVRIGDSCIALAGSSGMGKSTLAATLVKRGASLTADDVSVVDLSAPASPSILPAYPQMKLWRNSLDNLDIAAEGLLRVRRSFEKYAVPAATFFDSRPVRLAAIYGLADAGGMQQAEIGRLDGLDALGELTMNFYRRRLAAAMNLQNDSMRAALKILAAVPLYRLPLTRSFDALGAIAEELLSRHRSGLPS